LGQEFSVQQCRSTLRLPVVAALGNLPTIGAALTVSGIELSAVPHRLMDFAQLMVGLVLGARYERAFFAGYRMLYLLLYSTPFSFSSPLSSLPRRSPGRSACRSQR
jgi:uncharacterized membrane protein AbrB (regulator of aidB expression)